MLLKALGAGLIAGAYANCKDQYPEDQPGLVIKGLGKDHIFFTNKHWNATTIRCDLSATDYESWNGEKPALSMGKLFCDGAGWYSKRGAPVCTKPDPCPDHEEMPLDEFGLTFLAESVNSDGTVNQRYSLVTVKNRIPNYRPYNGWTMAFRVKASNKVSSGYIGVLDGENVKVSKNNNIISFTDIKSDSSAQPLPKIFMTEVLLIRVPAGTSLKFDRAWQYRYRFVNTNCLDVNWGTFANEDLTPFKEGSQVPGYDATSGLQAAHDDITWDGSHYNQYTQITNYRKWKANKRARMFGNRG